MTDISKLQEEELNQLNKTENVELLEDIVNLEELILLGDEKRIPILIEYPLPDGKRVKTKALVKQLTIKELDNMKFTEENLLPNSIRILQKAMFKQNGDNFKKAEIQTMPIGAVRAIANTILELSGVDEKTRAELPNF